jgi:hypothetical protein
VIGVDCFAAFRLILLNFVEVVCSFSYKIVYIFKSEQKENNNRTSILRLCFAFSNVNECNGDFSSIESGGPRWPVSIVVRALSGRGVHGRIKLGGDVEAISPSILVDLLGCGCPDQVSSSPVGQDNFGDEGGVLCHSFQHSILRS